MVDPTRSIGQLQGTGATERTQPKPEPRKHDKTDETEKKRRDEIVASRKKALSAKEAEDTSRDTRKKLENSSHSLGKGGQVFDETV